ncbi:MAG: hypothetical protein OQK00_06385, partial [Rhodobacteraceae bacterium]|nr:hypothetical protein [Paracoccaceae bacterium]
MNFDVTHEGRTTLAVDYAGALDIGYPAAIAGAALKSAARAQVAAFADGYRHRLSLASAGKLTAYRIKEEVAADTDNADPAELALIDREATARGLTREALLAEITARATAYRQIALLIECIEAETNAGLTAIPDDAADIETQIHTVLDAAKAQAE